MTSTSTSTTTQTQRGYSGRDYFQQDAPHLGNQYLEDSYLLQALQRVMPQPVLAEIEPDLINYGRRVVTDILQWGRAAENNPPKHIAYDSWGRRVDRIVVDEAWNILKDDSAREGLVSIGYERKQGAYSRLYQYLKVYLQACSSAVFDCPLSMTDGAARLIELYGGIDMQEVYQHFITRDPDQFWTSGQWMTEKTGGSDIANSETLAVERADVPDTYDISGYKYFTSATTANCAILLARDKGCDKDSKFVKGSRGLSAFFIKIRKEDGELNNMLIHKLKNKFGTKAVPTTEIELLGTPGKMIGPKGRGVPVIASILNVTRIHNVLHSVATMRRGVALARDFSHRRRVNDAKLADNPLYQSTLAEMEIEYRAGLQFLLDVCLLLGKSELAESKKQDSLLRILTPLSKLYTAKQSIMVASETIECMGGTGYMEDSDVPRLLRDTQVTSIWEGTTNVLSMDVWRAIKSHNSLEVFVEYVGEKINSSSKDMSYAKGIIAKALTQCVQVYDRHKANSELDLAMANAKKFSYLLSQTYMAALLFEHAAWSKKSTDVLVCNRWCFTKLQASKIDGASIAFAGADKEWKDLDRVLALDLDEKGEPRGYGNKSTTSRDFGVPRARY
ncbi:hypothetical protein SAMD00019534_114070, partial [Acytostelium subglobosum LB1]|uniref:hypothetical protein n=1 Tax=Acytostelium subglobosum LB1 TaxID=1410327 RepID=UPI000644E819